jgi:hypothetical protein
MQPTDEEIREMAKVRVSFRANALSYVLVNLFLIGIWWFSSGGESPTLGRTEGAYFWPIWPILGWGLGLAFHAYGAYGGGSGAVAREEEKLRQKYKQN